MSRQRVGGGINDISVIEEKEISTLSQLMDDESTTEENTAEIPISDERSGHKTIFLFPAIMEIRQQRAKVVTIGLYHHKESMLFGDDYKRQVVDVMTHAFQLDKGMFFVNMGKQEKELRGCYEEEGEYSYPMDKKEFLHILFLDGCFILFALRCFSNKNRPSLDTVELFITKLQRLGEGILMYRLINNLKILVSSLEMHQESVICDLLQMENQIPYSVLQELLRICPGLTDLVGSSIRDLALSCFKHVQPKTNKEKSESPEDFLHLLDLFHWSRVPKDKYTIDNRTKSQTLSGFCILHAADFHRSGMKFKKNSGSSLDVEIKNLSCRKNYVIKIPPIDVKNYQFSVFESLVTFEARYKKRGFCFTAFVECMASLLGSEKDVKVLQKSGIIPKGTEASDDYVIKFFHQLCCCINPVALMPHPYDGYKNAVDRVRETVEMSKQTDVRCWFRF